jgi:hypothetical protein
VLAITRIVRATQGIVNQTPPFHESRGIKHPKIRPARKYSMPEHYISFQLKFSEISIIRERLMEYLSGNRTIVLRIKE